jgi:hypothetical protein
MYMERYWLVPYSWNLPFAVRVHHICTEDLDRELHDHPWAFVSVVLRGGYREQRPWDESKPDHLGLNAGRYGQFIDRAAGSIVLRNAYCRHRITFVRPDTWTLFITGPKRHWWGFYTRAGKVYHKDYPERLGGKEVSSEK